MYVRGSKSKMLNFIFLLQISFLSSADCHYLAACSRDDTIKIIDLRTNQILTSLSHDNYKVACDFARISFNADSSHVAAGASDGSIFIWNVNGVLTTTLKEHTWVQQQTFNMRISLYLSYNSFSTPTLLQICRPRCEFSLIKFSPSIGWPYEEMHHLDALLNHFRWTHNWRRWNRKHFQVKDILNHDDVYVHRNYTLKI